MGWFTVHSPVGHEVDLNSDQCIRVRPADSMAPPGAHASIDVEGGVQHCRETVEEARKLMKGAT